MCKEILCVGKDHWRVFWLTTEELVEYFTCPECGGFLGELERNEYTTFRTCRECGVSYVSA